MPRVWDPSISSLTLLLCPPPPPPVPPPPPPPAPSPSPTGPRTRPFGASQVHGSTRVTFTLRGHCGSSPGRSPSSILLDSFDADFQLFPTNRLSADLLIRVQGSRSASPPLSSGSISPSPIVRLILLPLTLFKPRDLNDYYETCILVLIGSFA
jgi:hypothetical protein